MSYCKSCGNEVNQNQDYCPSCGASLNARYTNSQNVSNVDDTGGFGWGLLGFCVPIVGLVLYLVWKQEKPITAKAAGTGALISAIAYVVFFIVYFVFIIAMLQNLE